MSLIVFVAVVETVAVGTLSTILAVAFPTFRFVWLVWLTILLSLRFRFSLRLLFGLASTSTFSGGFRSQSGQDGCRGNLAVESILCLRSLSIGGSRLALIQIQRERAKHSVQR